MLPAADALGLVAHVLGPQRDEAKLRKDRPSTGPAKEVYLTKMDETSALTSALWSEIRKLGVAGAAIAAEEDLQPDEENASPFGRPHRIGDKVTSIKDPRWKLRESYEAAKYRQIEYEWVGAAEALALKLDADTNNTSLALAMELPDGQVLLSGIHAGALSGWVFLMTAFAGLLAGPPLSRRIAGASPVEAR